MGYRDDVPCKVVQHRHTLPHLPFDGVKVEEPRGLGGAHHVVQQARCALQRQLLDGIELGRELDLLVALQGLQVDAERNAGDAVQGELVEQRGNVDRARRSRRSRRSRRRRAMAMVMVNIIITTTTPLRTPSGGWRRDPCDAANLRVRVRVRVRVGVGVRG